MSKLRRIFANLADRPRLSCLVVFLFTVTLYGVVQAHPSFKDPDSFYHARLVALMAERGVVTDFSWLPFTTLADSFADHHLLYHLLTVPFVWLFGSLVGLKVATAFFGASAVTAFYLAIRILRVRAELSLISTLLLATSMNFMFRMNLAKAASLSVALLMLGVIAAVRRKWLALFALSFLYVWAHGSWPLFGFVVLVFVAVQLRRIKKWGCSVRLLAATVLGMAAGLIVNPYFPQNLFFYWYQTMHAAVLNYGDVINVGVEWRAYDLRYLIPQNAAPLVLLAICGAVTLAAFFWSARAARNNSATKDLEKRFSVVVVLAIISAVFLAMAIRSQRHIEYFVPFGLLFGAAWLDYLVRRYDLSKFWSLIYGGRQRLGRGVIIFFGLVFVVSAVRDSFMIVDTFHDESSTFAWTQYEPATEWMHNHLPDEVVIFHGSWGDFPPLFYHASEFRYVAGLDPTFLYLKNPARFAEWRAASEGRVRDFSEAMASFDSKYVFVTSRQEKLDGAARADDDLHLVYEDDEAKIYMIFP